MAQKKSISKTIKRSNVKFGPVEFSQWNFILFLTLSFILLVVVLNAMTGLTNDIRTRAMYGNCPSKVQAPRAEDCAGGTWLYKRGNDGCPGFFCNPTK
jgi:hypothetical protein